MKELAAFFDLDGTLISEKSLISFIKFIQVNKRLDIPHIDEFIEDLIFRFKRGDPRKELNRYYFSIFEHISESDIEREAEAWVAFMENHSDFYIDYTMRELQRRRASGFKIILVTGSFNPLLNALNQTIGADEFLCSCPESVNGVYTGQLIGDPCIGKEKKHRVLEYADYRNIDLSRSWAFGDDESDIYMLNAVGNGVRVKSYDYQRNTLY